MIKRPIMIACAGFLVVLVALLLLFLSDEEVVDKNMAGSTTEKNNEPESSQQDLIIKSQEKLKNSVDSNLQEQTPVVAPKFDVVRVDPEGNIVLAGRAQPNSIIEIKSGAKEIGRVKADSRGEWVFVPGFQLKPGNIILTLKDSTDPGNIVESQNAVVIGIPGADSKNRKPLAMVVPRSEVDKQPTQVVQAPGLEVSKPPSTNDKEKEKNFEEGTKEKLILTINTIDYDDGDLMVLSGKATAQKFLRVYIDDKIEGSTRSSKAETWSFQVQSKLTPGLYQIRVDLVSEDGKVRKRIQVPFEKVKPINMKNERRTVIIKPGNNLWRIAARVYGSGFRYTEIYKANLDQIRDPDLIYPGQVFKLPHLAQ